MFAGITEEQLRAQYAKNARQLRDMAIQARRLAPKRFRGFTANELEAKALEYERRAQGTFTK